MKGVVIILLFLWNFCFSQIKTNDGHPSFPGGTPALNEFLKKNIVYPNECSDKHFTGCKVFVKFTVNEDGTVTDPQIVKGCPGLDKCDAEVLRVVALMPKWIPATKDNVPIKRTFSLPVKFNIQ